MPSKNVLDLLAVAKIGIITDASAIDRESKELAQHIEDSDKRIQTYLFSEMLHIEDHRNTTRINTFLTRIRQSGARVSAMRSFVEAYFNVRLNPIMMPQASKEQKKAAKDCFDNNGYYPYYVLRDKRSATVLNEKVKAAIQKPWWKHRPEKDDPVYNLTSKVETAMASMWRAALTASEDDTIDADLLRDLTDVCIAHGLTVGKLIPNVKTEELTKKSNVLSVRTAIQSANSNAPVKAEVKTEAEDKDRVVNAPVEVKSRKRKAA